MLTRSLCNTCGKEIQADIAIGNSVYILKNCPEHGVQWGIVERDAEFYVRTKRLGCKNIYDGYILDVTGKCNLNCKVCYHDKQDGHKTVGEIVQEALTRPTGEPIILSGGEPLLHPAIVEVVKQISEFAPVYLLSNGVALDAKMLEALCSNGLLEGNMVKIGLSYHPESNGDEKRIFELFRKESLKMHTFFYVINALADIDKAITMHEENQDVLTLMRIKAASNIWNTQDVKNHIFTSDMVKYFLAKGDTFMDERFNQKVSYASILHKGLQYRLISWYDKANIDLDDIACAPYYRCKDGKVYDFVQAMLRNEQC